MRAGRRTGQASFGPLEGPHEYQEECVWAGGWGAQRFYPRAGRNHFHHKGFSSGSIDVDP